MPEQYYFLHIPKTAGTSLTQWLAESNLFSICPDGLWSLLLRRPKNELDKYSLFCGHFYRYLSTYLGRHLRTFTFLRNPFDRTISHYEHIRHDPAHYFHERVIKQGSLIAFLKDPITQPLVKNFQVRVLSAVFDPFSFSAIIASSPEQRYPLEQYLETADSGLTDSKALLLAKDFLTSCIFVGISERMQESIDVLANILGIPNNTALKRLNANPANSSTNHLSQEELVTIANLVDADWKLYEFALRTFHD